jgi:hypothetical protein
VIDRTIEQLIDDIMGCNALPYELDVRNYKEFHKVCDVAVDNNKWYYKNINHDIMYDEHRSWVYLIVDGFTIKKVGETGRRLGIPESKQDIIGCQPVSGSTNRLGRYRAGDGTDLYIRSALKSAVLSGTVSFWALRCPVTSITVTVSGKKFKVNRQHHKDLEESIIDAIEKATGARPALNKNSK